jgi:hypothetical protein
VRRILVLANQTLAGARLVQALKDRAAQEEARFFIVVPQTRPRHGNIIYDDAVRTMAQVRVDRGVEVLSRAGLDAQGEVGDEDPFLAAMDGVREHDVDEIIVSTLPATASGWLRRDLPERLELESGLPVEHVVVDLDREELRFHGTLVVANQTVAGDALIEHLKQKARGDVEQRYIVLVPQDSGDGQASARARARMEKLLDSLHAEDIPAVGMIGDPDPYTATMNAVDFFHLHDIVISTLPSNRSEWLKANLIERVEKGTGKTVEHVESTADEPAPAQA